MPYGIRDKAGFLLFFQSVDMYTGQKNRYMRELAAQERLAAFLLKQLQECGGAE